MKIEICHPTELGQSEVDRWRSIQRADPALASPFLAPEFTVVAGALNPHVRVGVLFDGTQIVGFFPFERGGLGIGTPICPGHNNAQGLIGVTGLDWEPRGLLRACGLVVWEFDHLVEGQRPFERYENARVAAPMMDLSAGVEPWLQHLRCRKSKFGDLTRRRRKLAREVGEERFVFTSDDPRALHTVMKWKSDQYLRTGWSDRFASSRTVELLELLLDTRTESFSGVLSMLYVGDEPVAGHFGLRSDHVMAYWFPSYNRHLSAYAPGMIMILDLAEAAHAAGIDRVEMGPGGEDYKRWFCNRDLFVTRGCVVRPSLSGGLHWATRASMNRVHRVVVEHPSLHLTAQRARARYVRAEAALRRRTSTRTLVRMENPPQICAAGKQLSNPGGD
jgi:CelD/BcsL family acetyltransferase involved in cellulose biosynthesis